MEDRRPYARRLELSTKLTEASNFLSIQVKRGPPLPLPHSTPPSLARIGRKRLEGSNQRQKNYNNNNKPTAQLPADSTSTLFPNKSRELRQWPV